MRWFLSDSFLLFRRWLGGGPKGRRGVGHAPCFEANAAPPCHMAVPLFCLAALLLFGGPWPALRLSSRRPSPLARSRSLVRARRSLARSLLVRGLGLAAWSGAGAAALRNCQACFSVTDVGWTAFYCRRAHPSFTMWRLLGDTTRRLTDGQHICRWALEP